MLGATCVWSRDVSVYLSQSFAASICIEERLMEFSRLNFLSEAEQKNRIYEIIRGVKVGKKRRGSTRM